MPVTNDRGFSLVELLIALAIVSVVGVMVGVTSNGFFATVQRVDIQNNAQTWLQRQAAIINDELARQIQPATNLVTPCPGAIPDSLQVTRPKNPATDPAGWPDPVLVCFRRNSSSGTQFLEDRPGGQWNLLTVGRPALPNDQQLSTTSGTCPSSGGFCVNVSPDGRSATVTFRLRFHMPEVAAGNFQTMTFTTTFARRNISL